MAKYLFIGTEPRHFPTLGLVLEPAVDAEGNATGEPVPFETDLAVVSPLVLDAKGNPTTDAGTVVPNNATDIMDAPAPDEAAAPVAEYTLEDLTKAELLDLAHDLELHGRSQMTKPELIAALREAAQVAVDSAVGAVGQTETDQTEPVAGEGDTTDPEE